MSSRYAKQKSKPDNTCDIRYQNAPGREQIPNGATFQCHFLLAGAIAVLGFASGLSPIDDIQISDLMKRRFYSSVILLISL